MRYRRAVGLLAFIYASLHLTTYLVLDQKLDFVAIWADIVKRPYITIGMAAFLILVPLAITSNNAMIRRLGGPAWQKLHRWVYLAVAAGVVHYILVAKVWEKQSAVYAGLVVLLLGYRAMVRLQRSAAPSRRSTGAGPRRARGPRDQPVGAGAGWLRRVTTRSAQKRDRHPQPEGDAKRERQSQARAERPVIICAT